MGQRYEYKNAANVYTETDYTPAHREATTRLMQSIYDVLSGDIAGRRKMDVAAFKGLIDQMMREEKQPDLGDETGEQV